MTCRNSFVSVLPACLLTVAFLGVAPVTHAAPGGSYLLHPDQGLASNVIEIKDRGRVPRTYVPIAPSYRYYDYPYCYSRGYYPIHIRPGFIYYGYPYATYRSLYARRYGARCSAWHRRCVAHKSVRRHSHQRSGTCRCL